MANEQIKPCPFCASLEVEICRTNESACWVRCADCGTDAPAGKTRKTAIFIWNSRPLQPQGVFSTIVDDQDKRVG
jgi:hypothetical protein